MSDCQAWLTQPTPCSQLSSCSSRDLWRGWQQGSGSEQADSHCAPGPLPAVPDALHLSEGAGSKKTEPMSRKQLSWAFPGLGVAQPPIFPHLGGTLVPGWGHGGFVTLVQARGCSQDAPDMDAEPSCLARPFPAPPDPLNYLCSRKRGAELGLAGGEAPVNTAFPRE